MSTLENSSRIDRRVALQWMMAAAAGLAVRERTSLAAEGAPAITAKGYGPDPVMAKIYVPGDLWPLTLTEPQRRTARALCDVIIPADETSPSASGVGVPEFIDEWISAPYAAQAADRPGVLKGLRWIDEEAQRRFAQAFADLTSEQQTAICEDLSHPAKAKPEHRAGVSFFKRYRDLTVGGYYTTPEGMKALGYIGNTPAASFDGPPIEALRHVGLA